MAWELNLAQQAPLEVVHPNGRFQQVDFNIQRITPRTAGCNTKLLEILDIFTGFLRDKAIPDEWTESISRAPIDEWISIFGPMETLTSDGGPKLAGSVVKSLIDFLDIVIIKAYQFHPLANCTVERWNRALIKDLAIFVATDTED